MSSSVTFETALLADAIKKAAKIAPNRGAAFDKAAGIIFEFDPASPLPLAVVRATNLDIFCIEWINVTEWSGEAAQWRLPSIVLASVVSALPIGSDKTVTFTSEVTDHSFIVHMSSGKTRAKFYPMDAAYYPHWGAFNPDSMHPAPDLGGRIDQVEWAASNTEPRLAGVYLDGTNAVATDTYRLACVPLSIPDLQQPIVVPAGLLGQVLRQTGDIQVGVSDRMLNIMPDEFTQMKTVLYDVKYPNVDRVMNMEFDTEVKVSRDRILETMTMVNSFSAGDRAAGFRVFFGMEQIAIYMLNDQLGSIGDAIDYPGQMTHERFELKFTPKNIMEALQKAPNDAVTLKYNQGMIKSLLHIDGGSGYRAWAIPRVQKGPEE